MSGSTIFTIRPVGIARTPYTHPDECPSQPDPDGPGCQLEIEAAYASGLVGLEDVDQIDVLFWLDGADRQRLQVVPRPHPERGEVGVFALRSPDRPNPIGVSTVPLVRVEGRTVIVRGLDALDRTPIIDLKAAWRPERATSGVGITRS